MENNQDVTLELSPLGHTWLLDLDGTIVKHNGYKIDGYDTLLEGAKAFLDSIPPDDMVIFITARKIEYKTATEEFLKKNQIRYNHIIFEAPYGERVLINDNKPSGLQMGIACNKQRDANVFPSININPDK